MVMQVNARTKNKSCTYKTVNSGKKDPKEAYGKLFFSHQPKSADLDGLGGEL